MSMILHFKNMYQFRTNLGDVIKLCKNQKLTTLTDILKVKNSITL